MKTLGYTKVVLLPLMILASTMGSSIASQIQQTESNILEESTLPKKENQKEENEKLHQSPTGKSTMEALDDGSPMYYNSNILGRYMRKDYGQFHEKSKDDI